MPDRIPPIPRLFNRRLALRSMLDRLRVRGQICWPCRYIRLLVILVVVGFIIGLLTAG